MPDFITPFDHPRGERDERGRFEPFYVPRPIMPQVDEADLPDLIDFVRTQGVSVTTSIREATSLHCHQHVEAKHIKMSPELENKPVLISSDDYILDGAHRDVAHRRDGTLVSCIVIGLPFGPAIDMIFTFPRTYTLAEAGDEIRN